MQNDRPNPMQCTEFEALLADAIDGALAAPQREQFRGHAGACATCGPLFAQAQAGHAGIKSLDAVEPPPYLVQKILNVTTEAEARKPAAERAGWRQRALGWFGPGMRPVMAGMMQPRFGMSVAMAFFSITLLLNLTGVRLSDMKHLDLRPSAIQRNVVRGYNESAAKVEKYYENLRFVYEIQSSLRELRNSAADQPAQPQPAKPQPPADDNTSEQPEQKNERYSLEKSPVRMAAAQPASVPTGKNTEARNRRDA